MSDKEEEEKIPATIPFTPSFGELIIKSQRTPCSRAMRHPGPNLDDQTPRKKCGNIVSDATRQTSTPTQQQRPSARREEEKIDNHETPCGKEGKDKHEERHQREKTRDD